MGNFNQHLPPPEPSDESLVARIVQHDKAAFAMIYDRYARSVYALAAHMLGATEAEEIVQEVFMRLWNKAHQYDPARPICRLVHDHRPQPSERYIEES